MKKFKFRTYGVEITLIAVSLLVHLYIALRPVDILMNWYTSDDSFYYFKVAANIANGLGSTFDGISRTNGFHPLWMLVCIPVFSLARFDLFLPLRVLILVSAAINAGTAILILHLLRKFLSFATAAAMAVVWTFLPSIHSVVVQNGMESAISGFFLALLIYLAITWRDEPLKIGRLSVLGTVAGLAILSRLDNIFVVLLLGVWFVLSQTSGYLRAVVLSDLVFIFFAGLLGYYFRLLPGPGYVPYSPELTWHLGLSFLLIPVSLFLFDLYRPVPEKISWKFLLRCSLAVALPSALIGIGLLIFPQLGLLATISRSVIPIVFMATWLCILGIRLVAGRLFRHEAYSGNESIRSWGFFEGLLPRTIGYFFPAGLLLGLYMLWSYWYVGIPMPISGTIKHWWGSLSSTVYGSTHHTLLELFGFSGRWNAWSLALSPQTFFANSARLFLQAGPTGTVARILSILLAVVVLVIVILQYKWLSSVIQKMGLLAIFIGLYAQIFEYSSTSYLHVRSWYWVGQMLFTVLCLGLLLECALKSLKMLQLKPYLWPAVMGLVSLAVMASFGGMVAKYFQISNPPGQAGEFMAGIHNVEDFTEPGALIGMTGGGTIGYFIQDRTVVNLDGLINGLEYFRLLRIGKGYLYLDKIGLDYVLGGDEMLNHSDPYRNLFENRLEPLAGGEAAFAEGGTLYRYIPNVDNSVGMEIPR